MIKIGVITGHFPPKSNAGSMRIKSFVQAWRKKEGAEIFVYTEKKPNNNTEEIFDNVIINRTKFKIADNKKNIFMRILSEIYFSILIFFKLVFKNIDVYFVSSPPFLINLSVMIVSKIKRTPYVVDIRDIYPEVLFQNNILKRNSLIGKLLELLEKTIYNNALMVVTVTEGLKKYIEGKTNSEVYLIRNGIDRDLFYNMQYKKDKEKFIIIFHGTLGKQQNIEFIIDYAKFLKNNNVTDIKIWIIGRGPKTNLLQNAVKKYNLHEWIIYKGFKDISEIPCYINQADIGFSPRTDDIISKTAFPVKIYEYLGCGIPVIVSPESEAGNFVEENNIGFQVKNNELEKLHNKVSMLKNNKELYESYSEKACKVSLMFDRSEFANKLYNLIRKDLN